MADRVMSFRIKENIFQGLKKIWEKKNVTWTEFLNEVLRDYLRILALREKLEKKVTKLGTQTLFKTISGEDLKPLLKDINEILKLLNEVRKF